MDLFRFGTVTTDGHISNGIALNGMKSVMWVERFRPPGEFTIKAPVSSQLRTLLPIGSLISHTNTREVMMVESHEIDDNVQDKEPEIEIKGSSLDAYLKQRNVGDDLETYVALGHRLVLNRNDYALAFDTSWAQAVTLIAGHINAVFNIPNDEVAAFIPISNQQHIGSSTSEARVIKLGNLHQAVLELLAIDDFGIKIVRPHSGNVDPTTTEFRIHNGNDLRDSVIFSHALGDLPAAQYFWSDKALKTDYLCVSTYFALRSDSVITGFPRRVMYVDCADIDGHLTDLEVADGSIMEAVGDAMDVRGQMLLRAQTSQSILSTDVSRQTQYKFREDYDVGDLVTVNGNYDVSSIMRVTEHVEFQDENGETGYPTLSALNE